MFTTSLKLTAKGTFADGVNVTSLDSASLATALKIKLGMKV